MDRNLPIKSQTHKGDLSLNKTRSPKIRKGAWIKKETDRQTDRQKDTGIQCRKCSDWTPVAFVWKNV